MSVACGTGKRRDSEVSRAVEQAGRRMISYKDTDCAQCQSERSWRRPLHHTSHLAECRSSRQHTCIHRALCEPHFPFITHPPKSVSWKEMGQEAHVRVKRGGRFIFTSQATLLCNLWTEEMCGGCFCLLPAQLSSSGVIIVGRHLGITGALFFPCCS